MTTPGPIEAIGGGVAAASALDYIGSGRPDLFETETMLKSSILRDPKALAGGGQPPSYLITIFTIGMSAFLFVTVIAWFSVLQASLDAAVVNPALKPTALSRLYFSIFATVITGMVLGAFIMYMRSRV